MPREQTYIMIKPDGVQRGIIGNIIARFEEKGFKLAAMKMCTPSKEHLEKHYADLSGKKFFPSLIDYMLMGPVVCMVWEGDNVVKTGRQMLGATNPADSLPGTIRGDLCIDVGRNICHGSDAVESAQAEIALWFPEGLNQYSHVSEAWVYEKVEEVAESKAESKVDESDLLTAGAEYNEYITYDDDAALGQDCPSLAGLEACQFGPVPQLTDEKVTIVYFWAKFLKWQCYPSLVALHELNKAQANLQVIAVSVDPKKSAIESHMKKAKKYTAEMGVKSEGWTGGKTDLCLCFDEGNKIKDLFRKLTRMDAFMAPQAFIVCKGKVVWRQSFSAGYPYNKSRFESQLAAVVAGKPLYMFGPNPKPQEPEEELEGYGDDEEADDVFAAAAKDNAGADGAW